MKGPAWFGYKRHFNASQQAAEVFANGVDITDNNALVAITKGHDSAIAELRNHFKNSARMAGNACCNITLVDF